MMTSVMLAFGALEKLFGSFMYDFSPSESKLKVRSRRRAPLLRSRDRESAPCREPAVSPQRAIQYPGPHRTCG